MVNSIRNYIWFAFSWMFILVVFGIFLSPPTLFVREFLGIELSAIEMPARAALYIHVVAVILTAILAFSVIQLFKINLFVERFVLLIGTAGYIITSISAIVFAYFFRHPVPHGIYLFGLSLMFLTLLALLYEFIPKRGEKTTQERISLFIMLILMTITVILGAIYGSNRNELLVHTEQWQRILNSHIHTILVILPMSLVILIVEKFKLLKEGTKRFINIGHLALGTATLGAFIAVVANYIYIWIGPIAHKIITPASALVLGGSLIIMIQGFIKTMKVGNLSFVKTLLMEPVKTGMLWILFWVNIVVAGPGIYIAINLDYFKQPEMARVLEAFEHGHYHILALLTGLTLLYLILDYYPINNFIKHKVGLIGTVGYILATGATVIYMFTNPDPYNHFILPIIDIGLTLTALAVFGSYIGLTALILKKKSN